MRANRGECLCTLRPGQQYLWTVSTEQADAKIACRLQVVLSKDEQEEGRRFHHARDRHQFIITRALVRLVLSHHFPVPANDWRFGRDHNRKPFITSPRGAPAVQFSLSHTDGLIACLITLSAQAAVDVERIEYSEDLPLVARQVLSPAELRALNNLSGRDWTARFFDFWTLKEAYAKARGMGLGLRLSDIQFELGTKEILAHFDSSIGDDASAWVFWNRQLPSKHTISVATKKDFDCQLEVVRRSVKFDGISTSRSIAYEEWPE